MLFYIALDLLYDIDPAYFIQNVEAFIKSQVKEDRINLFLSNLSELVLEGLIILVRTAREKGRITTSCFLRKGNRLIGTSARGSAPRSFLF